MLTNAGLFFLSLNFAFSLTEKDMDEVSQVSDMFTWQHKSNLFCLPKETTDKVQNVKVLIIFLFHLLII
jgi:hypothetical protein